MKRKVARRAAPPEMPHDELLRRTSEVVQECGVEMQTQAQFSYALSKEIIGSHDFRLASLQPDVKVREGPAWSRAYSLAIQFLQEFDMKTSLSTIEREFRSKPIPRDSAFLRRQRPSAYVDQLLQRVEPEPFRAQIAAFAAVPGGSPRARSPKVLATSANRLREQLRASQSKGAGSRAQSTPRRSARP